jgi:hypothetical protein
MNTNELADLIIERLNDIAETDRAAIDALLKVRVLCNEAMATHPTVQVVGLEDGGMVGVLGILNGIVGVIDDGPHKIGASSRPSLVTMVGSYDLCGRTLSTMIAR